MNAIKSARKFIQTHPEHSDAVTLTRLVVALESGASFELAPLYEMELERFELALDILREWRLDRYYTGKAKLLDVSLQVHERAAEPAAPAKG